MMNHSEYVKWLQTSPEQGWTAEDTLHLAAMLQRGPLAKAMGFLQKEADANTLQLINSINLHADTDEAVRLQGRIKGIDRVVEAFVELATEEEEEEDARPSDTGSDAWSEHTSRRAGPEYDVRGAS